jgi:hypothetical protein
VRTERKWTTYPWVRLYGNSAKNAYMTPVGGSHHAPVVGISLLYSDHLLVAYAFFAVFML